MKRKLAGLAVTFVSAAILAACGAAPSSNATNVEGTAIGDTIKIGANLELTGDVSAYGRAEQRGAELAAEEINANGGVAGKKIELVTKDNKSDNSEAATVTTNLATESKVNAIVGPATSSAVASASPNAQSVGVPLVTPSGTQDDLTVGSDNKPYDYIFRTTFVDSYQGQVLAKYATDVLQAKKVVLYYDNSSDYAKGIAEQFKDTYQGEITAEATYQAKETDFQSALTQFKNGDYDAVVMPGYYQEAGTIIKQAREMGIDVPIIGPDGFADERLIELAGANNATNVHYISGYSADSSDKASAFAQAYKDKYKEEPSMFAALAYDAVLMVAKASEGAENSKDIASNLATIKDFEGATGLMTIDANHNPIKSVSLVILTEGKTSGSSIVDAD